jgi:hypothetical protein
VLPRVTLTGIDLCPATLAVARDRAETLGLGGMTNGDGQR